MLPQIPWCAALALGILAFTGVSLLACAATDVGQPAPSLVVQELGGQTFDLRAVRGEVVIVSFWATLVSTVSRGNAGSRRFLSALPWPGG